MALGRYYHMLNSILALARLAILNTWNKNKKTEVISRNNVEVLTPHILQWMPMPMVERHVQACLNFSLSFCLRVRAVAWRHARASNAETQLLGYIAWQWDRYLVPQNVFLVCYTLAILKIPNWLTDSLLIVIIETVCCAVQIRSFKALPQSDQIHLLKGGSIELLILRSVITFDKEKQHFLDPVDRPETRAMNIDQLRVAESGTGLFDAHMKFVRTLAVDLHADETTLILLLVISLFSPDRGRLECELLIESHQQEYCMLLQRYLQSRYPAAIARSLFPRLLMTLTDIRNLDEEHSHVLLKVNPEGIQPLMKEVFDLNLWLDMVCYMVLCHFVSWSQWSGVRTSQWCYWNNVLSLFCWLC